MSGIKVGKVKCLYATDRALQVVSVASDCILGKMWIPKSVVHDDSEVYLENHEGEMVVEQWFAEKQGWIGEH